MFKLGSDARICIASGIRPALCRMSLIQRTLLALRCGASPHSGEASNRSSSYGQSL
jgi:hypothetical protein